MVSTIKPNERRDHPGNRSEQAIRGNAEVGLQLFALGCGHTLPELDFVSLHKSEDEVQPSLWASSSPLSLAVLSKEYLFATRSLNSIIRFSQMFSPVRNIVCWRSSWLTLNSTTIDRRGEKRNL
jgi:hypothetical protein